jgi:nucleolar complex protein 2
MGKVKKSTKNYNKAQTKKAAKAGSGGSKKDGGSSKSGGAAAPVSAKKGKGGGMERHKIPKSELMEEEEVAEKVIQIKRPRKKDQDASIAKHGASFKGHKGDMQSLAEKDPEFFEFLKENDQSLLEFGEDESDNDEDDDEEEQMLEGEDDDEDDEEDSDSDEEEEEEEEKERERVEVTEKLVKAVVKGAKGGSLSNLRKLVSMFRSACIPSSGEMDADEGGDESSATSKYVIASSKMYQLVMDTALDSAHIAMYAQLGIDTDKAFPPSKEELEGMAKDPKWKRLQLTVLSFFKSYMHVLGGLTKTALTDGAEEPSHEEDEDDDDRKKKNNKNTGRNNNSGNKNKKKDGKKGGDDAPTGDSPSEVAVYLLRAIEPYVPLLTPMPRLCKNFMKVLLQLWSNGPEPTADPHSLRGHAFIRYRQIAITLPGAFAEEAYRSIYLTYARACKGFTEFSATSTLFMARSISELYGSDLVQAYQQGFLYIRQLALHLRTAVNKKTSDNVRQVTSWQYLNCLRLWTRVISAHPAEDELGALAFPLSQVLGGVLSMAESMYLCPLRFHVVQCLQSLAAHCQVFIPTAAKMIDVLEHQDITSKASSSTDVLPELTYTVKLPTDSLSRAPVRDLVVEEAITLIRHDAEVYRHHVGFPEYAYLTIRKLRVFAKGSKITKWRDLARTTASQLESISNDVKTARASLGKTPMQITEFEPLLPVGGAPAAARLNKLLSGRTRGVHALTDVRSGGAGANKAAPQQQQQQQQEKKKAAAKKGKKEIVVESESDDMDEEDEDEDEDEESDSDDASEDRHGGKVKKFDISAFLG